MSILYQHLMTGERGPLVK